MPSKPADPVLLLLIHDSQMLSAAGTDLRTCSRVLLTRCSAWQVQTIVSQHAEGWHEATLAWVVSNRVDVSHPKQGPVAILIQ